MKINSKTPIDLANFKTNIEPIYSSKNEYKTMLRQKIDTLAEYQQLLYAHDRYSVLVIFQAMDAAGKDGAIRHVFSGINPQGVQVFSFKKPSDEELDHDFLWRTTKALPERGRLGVFNRSYYEEVLVVKVHQAILKAHNIPPELITESIWQERYESINDFEKHLARNGTKIVKFFLHLSKDEQKRRFLSRIDNSHKNWKFSKFDIQERGYWDNYQTAYGQAIGATSTAHAPWNIIPADDKKNARLLIAQTLCDAFGELDMHYPHQSEQRVAELKAIRNDLEHD